MARKSTNRPADEDSVSSPWLLTVKDLQVCCDPALLDFEDTSNLEPLPGLIGQERALGAIKLAASITHADFNLFVLGPGGAGRHSAVQTLLEIEAANRSVPPDWVYVNDFANPDWPKAIALPSGTAQPLQKALEALVDDLATDIPALFESEQYQSRRSAFEQRLAARKQDAFEKVVEKSQGRGVTIMRTPMGFAIAGVRNGEVIKPDDFSTLSDSDRKAIESAVSLTEKDLEKHLKSIPRVEKDHRAAVALLNAEMAEQAVNESLETVFQTFGAIEAIKPYLASLRTDLIENAEIFLREGNGRQEGPFPAARARIHDEPAFHRYAVNVMVSNDPATSTGAPIITEPLPSLSNLIGKVDHISTMGALVTDFTLIRSGALHRANGGYLILDATRVLGEPLAWEALKRCLETRAIRISSAAEMLSLISTSTLEPEPIPLQVRVVLVGDALVQLLLTLYDPDFSRLFKLAADFSHDMPRTAESVGLFARMVAGACERDGLNPVSRDGVAVLIDVASRAAEDQGRMSLRIGTLWDLLREADFLTSASGKSVIDASQIAAARAAAEHRADRVRERLQQLIEEGTLIVATSGSTVGQVNGLTVTSSGLFGFGLPVRITARVRMGTGKVIDIEREVKLGGPIHSKGVLILSSYLATHYAGEVPLSLWASLVFEQSYGGIEGDSASVAELCALLSALAGIPISQSLAITGSINQMGEVQPIGGVNEKIEGFFDTCKAAGLTGQQGVLIPRRNVRNLMLRHDVIEAVSKGQFRIYAIAHVDEAMELLTGLAAGKRSGNGDFEDGSVNANVETRLRDFAYALRDFMRPLDMDQGIASDE
ncbi:Lon protease family protein [Cypionkella sp.]|uniref:Lon protease family protein n=1 Tax=Cypionkella sp. TaxID=2811411 RepID=UPI0027183BF7|nr:ATP-binding protein [Cypionkella sp.]MDO8986221.1 ATP-binding protein [Cypionkella sp.]MDP2050405.1 ATP-binding protein [Cypionkella sp.]